jgi:hypothetical protein
MNLAWLKKTFETNEMMAYGCPGRRNVCLIIGYTRIKAQL